MYRTEYGSISGGLQIPFAERRYAAFISFGRERLAWRFFLPLQAFCMPTLSLTVVLHIARWNSSDVVDCGLGIVD